jgi:hypothetical protein
MKILPPASVIAAAAPEGETATALAEASLDWSPCLIRGDFWLHDDWNTSLWHQLRQRAEAASPPHGANVIPMDRYRRTS